MDQDIIDHNALASSDRQIKIRGAGIAGVVSGV